MKYRLKKFYNDHEETIFVAGGAMVAYVACLFVQQKRYDRSLTRILEGGVIDNIERLNRGDGVSVILAHSRNGRTFRFDKDQ